MGDWPDSEASDLTGTIGWQPIATMSESLKDGRSVLLWIDPIGAFVCKWVPHLKQWVSRGPIVGGATHWAPINEPLDHHAAD